MILDLQAYDRIGALADVALSDLQNGNLVLLLPHLLHEFGQSLIIRKFQIQVKYFSMPVDDNVQFSKDTQCKNQKDQGDQDPFDITDAGRQPYAGTYP